MATRPVQLLGPASDLGDRGVELPHGLLGGERARAGAKHHDEIDPSGELGDTLAKPLTNQTLGAIAGDRRAHLASGDQAQSGSLGGFAIWGLRPLGGTQGDQQHEVAAGDTAARPLGSAELSALADAPPGRKAGPGHVGLRLTVRPRADDGRA